ncbi:MAG: methionine synthase II (cobalamin-independent) [Marivirga sp.]|jgi:methionine synthase II (cobalamin-independent)
MMSVGLTGSETANFQEITNAAYQRMVKKLTDCGFEIVSSEEAGQAEMFQDYTKMIGGTPSQAQIIRLYINCTDRLCLLRNKK